MSINSYKRKITCRFFAILITTFLGFQPVQAQSIPGIAVDSTKLVINDSLIPGLLVKVASYTATIDHANFMTSRRFNISRISSELPEIERKVKGFKSRLNKRGSQMNLRSLNTGIIMLQEISDKLAVFKNVLADFSVELSKSNAEVKTILRDPAIYSIVADTILKEELHEIRLEGAMLDSIQMSALSKLNLLQNKVAVNLLESTDISSDMTYLLVTLKMAMWYPEESPLFKAYDDEYQRSLGEITILGLSRGWKIIIIYMNEKWDVVLIGMLLFVFIFSWTLSNMRRIKRQENWDAVLEPVRFLNRSVLAACCMAFFTYMPFLFYNPPMAMLHAFELLRILILSFLLFPYLTRTSKFAWGLLCLLWIYYALDNLLLESAFGERWGLFFSGILLGIICIKLILSKKPNFVKLSESPATRALAIFTLIQVILSIIFNLTGRFTLAKIFGVSAVQCMMLGISLKVFSTMVLESIYLQSEAYHDSRFSDFISFNRLRHRFLRVLWILCTVVWLVSLLRNLTLYTVMSRLLGVFFNTTRTIGNVVFTFESVAVFICIIWLSSAISGFINFFFGNEKLKGAGKRSRIGSMMLLIRLAIWTVGFSIAVAAAGIPLDKLSIMIGALGIGIGFGLQNIVNNLVSGVILAFERPIQVGDLIEIGGKMGTVKEIGVRSSKINNNKGADMIVPNGDLLSQHLINWTMQDRNKLVEFVLSIPYRADLKMVKTLIRDTLVKDEKIMAEPGPDIQVQHLGDQSIDIQVSFWVFDLTEAGSIRSNAMIEVQETLAGAGIQLPVFRGFMVGTSALNHEEM